PGSVNCTPRMPSACAPATLSAWSSRKTTSAGLGPSVARTARGHSGAGLTDRRGELDTQCSKQGATGRGAATWATSVGALGGGGQGRGRDDLGALGGGVGRRGQPVPAGGQVLDQGDRARPQVQPRRDVQLDELRYLGGGERAPYASGHLLPVGRAVQFGTVVV